MTTVTKPYQDFVNNIDVVDAIKINAQLNALYNYINGTNIDLTNLAAAAYSMNSVASTLVERDASQNIAYNFSKSGLNPNLAFNPSARMGLSGWAATNAGGSAWAAIFGNYGEGGFFSSGNVTNAVPILTSTKIPILSGNSISLSAEMYASGVTVGAQSVDLQFFDSGGAPLSTLGRVNATNGSGWAKYSTTVTAPTNAAFVAVRCYGDGGFTTTSSSWRKIKVELGSVATTFSDDNTLNTQQFGNVLPLSQVLSGGNKTQNASASATIATAGTEVSINVAFPVAFGSAPEVYLTLKALSTSSATYATFQAASITATGFSLRANSGVAQTLSIGWIAIGP